ncbi:MAG: hypothetical protein EXR49_07305 [Dehalococcoidia bacterium]|nr:hypothetical protein [Dehalococcoidia bacterium]
MPQQHDARMRRAQETYLRHSGGAFQPPIAATDPPSKRAFMENIFQQAYADSWAHPGLDMKTRSLVSIAIMGTLGVEAEIKNHIRRAHHAGVTKDEVMAVLIHLGAYIGAPMAARAAAVASEVWAEKPARASKPGPTKPQGGKPRRRATRP